MRNVSRRIEKIEEKLNINRHEKPNVIVIVGLDDRKDLLPENVEEWLIYKEYIRKCPNTDLVLLFASSELKARGLSSGNPKENLQKATKDNELEKV
jgi:hypothetical protein